MKIPFLKNDKPEILKRSGYYQLYQCEYDVDYFHTELFEQLSVIYPPRIQKSVHSRQAEYLAGRYVAHYAIKAIGFPAIEIASGMNREPLWPNKLLGSITHTNSTALCAVAFKHECQYLGIDLARWITNEVAKDISHLIIDNEERQLLGEPFSDDNHALTMAFSAKESLFKALYPKVQAYFNFSAAKFESISLKDGTFSIRLNESLTPELSKGDLFDGVFYLKEHEIITILSKPH